MVKKKYLFSPKKGYVYIRVKGQYLGRITALEGTPEFDHQYWEILTGKKADAKHSAKALNQSFRNSDQWAGYSPRYRRDLEPVMLYLEEKLGGRDITRLVRKDIIASMDTNRHRVRFANYIASTLSVLFEHAIDIGWTDNNPAKGIRKLKTPKDRQRPHIPWTDAAVELWRSDANPLPRLIFEIGIGSVQRPSDWIGFRWSDFDGEALRLTQNKTGKELYLPCTPSLLIALNNAPKSGLTILTKEDGRPMDYHYLARHMLSERKRLGTTAFDLHALRYRGVMELAWAGCDDDEIASYSGHTSKDMIQKYAGKARQITRAKQARAKRN